MKALEEISRTLWHLHSQMISQLEAENIIFPIIASLIAGGTESAAAAVILAELAARRRSHNDSIEL